MAKNENNKSYLELESVQFTKMNPNYLISLKITAWLLEF